MGISFKDILQAHKLLQDEIIQSPCLLSKTLSEMTGAEVYLKFENLQFTASFKERGACVKLNSLTKAQRKNGVVAMSAGNHAQAVAYHARKLGCPAIIVMPKATPSTKILSTEALGAQVILHGNDLTQAYEHALEIEKKLKAQFIHPYDDEKVISGQATVAVEMLEQVKGLQALFVPTGGGGLLSGMSLAAKSINPKMQIIGVQTEQYPLMYNAYYGKKLKHGKSTLAEGIAVKKPGVITQKIIKKYTDSIVLVSERSIEKAILNLLEIEKTVVEGAGASGLAALMEDPKKWKNKKVGIVLSGGNIDLTVLSAVIQRGLVDSSRLVRLVIHLQDKPGAFLEVSRILAELGANIIEVTHQRAFSGLTLPEAIVELTLECRGVDHRRQIIKALEDQQIDVKRIT